MEQGSLVGVVLILIGVFVGAILKGVSPAFLFTVPAALLVVVLAAIGAGFLSSPMETNKSIGKLIGKALKKSGDHAAAETIGQVVAFADKARREGLLSLEDQVQKIEDPFLRKGLQMAIDGADPEQVRNVLESEVEAMKERHKSGQDLLMNIAIYAPSFGILGAVFGLIATMAKLEDPEKMAHGISAAFVATFWGIFMANGLFIPFSKKLKANSHHEAQQKQLVIEGVLSIQAGANPRVVEDMLLAFLPPAERAHIQEERKSA